MDQKNFAIGVLSTTAVILFVGLLVVQTRPTPAAASGMTVAGGDYQLTVGSVQTTANSVEELLYVIDGRAMKMNVYTFDAVRKSIEPVQPIDLKQMREMAGGAAGAAKPKKGRRRQGRP